MALRSLLTKLPALGLRSPPMGPLMGPLRALSPAAASRLFSSHGAPISNSYTPTKEELARGWAEIKRKNDDIDRGLEERRESRRQFSQVLRADIEQNVRDKKTLEMIMIASNAVIILSVPATLYMLNYF